MFADVLAWCTYNYYARAKRNAPRTPCLLYYRVFLWSTDNGGVESSSSYREGKLVDLVPTGTRRYGLKTMRRAAAAECLRRTGAATVQGEALLKIEFVSGAAVVLCCIYKLSINSVRVRLIFCSAPLWPSAFERFHDVYRCSTYTVAYFRLFVNCGEGRDHEHNITVTHITKKISESVESTNSYDNFRFWIKTWIYWCYNYVFFLSVYTFSDSLTR